MITLALDEFGDFEGIKNDNKPIGIAGVLYDDAGSKADLANERKRIAGFYKACIDSVANTIGPNSDLVYPDALHSLERYPVYCFLLLSALTVLQVPSSQATVSEAYLMVISLLMMNVQDAAILYAE